MKTKILFLISMIAMGMITHSQQSTMILTFTAEINGLHVPLDSIMIENMTQGGDTTLFAPDTVLNLYYITGISENEPIAENNFIVFQNSPNPIEASTKISIYVAEEENFRITISDIFGRQLVNKQYQLDKGTHFFIFYPGKENLYFFTAGTYHHFQTIKMFNSPYQANGSGNYKLDYYGQQSGINEYKSKTNLNNLTFNLGDTLRFTSFTYMGEQVITSSPTGDQTYYFDYSGYPCPATPTVMDNDGNTYNTVLIGTQCWMKENLKTTTYNNGTPIPNVTDNMEWAYQTSGAFVWYNNDINWKDSYGALYNWYATLDPNGLCPIGWHVSTNDEWTGLTDFINGISSPHGNELKSCRQEGSPLGGDCNTSEHPRWDEDNNNGNYGTDDYSFSGLPGGYRDIYGTFYDIGTYSYWWTTTTYYGLSWSRQLVYNMGYVEESALDRPLGFSVRCIRDDNNSVAPDVETGSVLNITPSSADVEGDIVDLGSSDVTQHGHCWSTEQNPTIFDNITELGAPITTGLFTSNLSELESETVYYVRAYAQYDDGIAYGDTVSFMTSEFVTGIPCPDMPYVSDIDGNIYNTVQISNQCWMKENLKTTSYNNGTAIPNITADNEWASLLSGAYVWFDNDSSWKEDYGAMYNWYATTDSNGLCPTGWHVPTHAEWTALTDYIGGESFPHGNELKSCRQVNSPLGGECETSEHPRWRQDSTHYGTDLYSFSGLPGGYRFSNGYFINIGNSGYWWASTENSTNNAWVRKLGFFFGYIDGFFTDKNKGYSVRCLRD